MSCFDNGFPYPQFYRLSQDTKYKLSILLLYTSRRLLIEKEGLERLRNATVMVLGVGGVGSHCIEALARSGIGAIDLIDNDFNYEKIYY